MKTLRKWINKVVEAFSVVIVAVMVLLVLWQVVARYLLNNPSTFTEALTRYLFVWLVLVTATYAFGSRDHMCISVLNARLKGRAKTAVNIAIEVLTILFAACVMTFGGSVITRMQMVSMDSSLHIPMGLVYSIIPICGVLTVFYCLCNIADELNRAKEAV
ncbi:MAG: TRAP transporter small permease [Gemmiger sp.]|nr:TRAP transporter small permease [Gemmiger sp.]MDY5782334.1 TRAP transporter small permease [Gemmiger sp.]